MAGNSWHRYGMNILRHCHPMYILRQTSQLANLPLTTTEVGLFG